MCWSFTHMSFYLVSCICPDMISWWIWQWNKFVQISEKVWQRPWQWLDKRLGKKAWAVHGKSKLTKTEKSETEQSKMHAHNFLWRQGDYSQIIRSGRPNSHFRILLWRFRAIDWKCANTSHQTLATKELAVASQHTVARFLFHQGISDQNNMTVITNPPYFHYINDWR
jgi:hypothetical protein